MARDPRIFNLLAALSTVPAPLGGAAAIADNDVLVAASRKDKWIRAASTNGPTNLTPGFIRALGVISFDIILCNGAGKPVPGAIIDITIPQATTVDPTTTSAPAANAGLLYEVPIVTVPVAAAAVLGGQSGRIIRLQANNVGRLTGVITANSGASNITLHLSYLHIRTTVVVRVIAA